MSIKIAYIYKNNSNTLDGVNKKVINTVLKWKSLNVDARIFVLVDNEENSLREYNDYPDLIEVIRFKGVIDFLINKNLLHPVNEWEPDAIYARGIDLYFSPSARKFFSSHKIVQEIHTNDITERWKILKESIREINISKMLSNSLYLLLRNHFLEKVNGVVLLNNELKKISPSSIPQIVIGDGINLIQGNFSSKKSSYVNQKYNIVFMGTQKHPWYGIDKVVKIANYLPDCNFHIIGLQGSDFEEFEIEHNNIQFYGFMDTNSYQLILQKCDVAIGSLSLYENNMTEGSPLKGREYLAFGLPCIIGYRDTDFFDNCPEFLLELPSTPDNVNNNLERIREFILKSKSIYIKEEDILHLDYSVKEKKRLAFIKQLTS